MSSGFKSSDEEKNQSADTKTSKKSAEFFLKYRWLLVILTAGIIALILSTPLLRKIYNHFFNKPIKLITSIKVNFQDSATVPPDGWVADYGQALSIRTAANQGKNNIYGWVKRSDKTPVDLTKNTVKRNASSNNLPASFIQMQGNTVDGFTGTPVEGMWEVRLQNGNYNVTVSVGDAADINSRHCINVEGINAIAGFVPAAGTKFKTATVAVTVSDGYLTIDAIGGMNTKLNTVTVKQLVSKRPYVKLVNPDNVSAYVSEFTSVSTSVLILPNGAINNATVTSANIYLTEKETGVMVPSSVSGTNDGDSLTLVPASPLKLNTSYKFNITAGVKDIADSALIPYSSTFTTGPASTSALIAVKFDKIDLPNAGGQHSTITVGPDGKLYALTLDGVIKRFVINPDGTLGDPQLLYSLQDEYGKRTQRLAIGFTFDPLATAANLIAWVTHDSFVFQHGPDWDGKLSRLTGRDLEKVEDVLVNLPRSAKDHLTNSIAFGPDGALYFTQGSNSAMGSPDITWDSREEHTLSGSILRLDVSKLSKLPLDVKTEEGGGDYNPYAADAALTIYASGIRNAYDLVWHSNGSLYVPTNGSAAGGSIPASEEGIRRPDGTVYNGPAVSALSKVKQTEKDFLFRVVKGGYYGHPNPARGEFVMNGGNPTYAVDPAEVANYPVGTLPDVNWRGFAFDFHNNTSPDGVIEYKSNTFNGALKGKLLVVRYSQHDDIMILCPGGQNNNITGAIDGHLIKGFSGFVDPLDITENTKNGNMYVSEIGGKGKITLLRTGK